MARFLTDKQIGKTIREILIGDEVRCAVAFWGDGARDALFLPKAHAQQARIICDLTMGGTNPAELELLGAPENPLLKHIKGLHAKLYLSNAGLVVTSANASNRGIGFVEVASLTECGTFHKPGSSVYNEAATWFERIWLKASDVDRNALDAAKRAWARRPHLGPPRTIAGQGSAGTLLRRIAAAPDAHRGMGIVFTLGEADHDDVAEAMTVAVAADDLLDNPNLTETDRSRLASWNPEHLFTGWSDAEVNAWPRRFLCAHRGKRGAFTYWCYDRFAEARLGKDDWSLFASPSPDLQFKLGMGPRAREAAKPEDELLRRIFKFLDGQTNVETGRSHNLCESPFHLDRLLTKVLGDDWR